MENISQISRLPYREDFYLEENENFGVAYEMKSMTQLFIRELRKRKDFSQDEYHKVIKAFLSADTFHKRQSRREYSKATGERLPALIHPVEVAIEALRRGEKAYMVIGALFHDVHEDTCFKAATEEDMQDTVADVDAVELMKILSKVSSDGQCSEISKRDYYEGLCKHEKHEEAIRLKAYDRISNLRSFGRMLDKCFLMTAADADKFFQRVEKYVRLTEQHTLAIVGIFAPELHAELQLLNLKLEHRLKIMRTIRLREIDSLPVVLAA